MGPYRCYNCTVLNAGMLPMVFQCYKTPKGTKSKLTRLCLRCLAVLFGTVVVISVVVAVTLVITQKPVDLSQSEQISYALKYQNYSRLVRLPTINYTKLTLTDLFNGEAREKPKPVVRWLSGQQIIFADSETYSLLNASDNFTTKRDILKSSAIENVTFYAGDTVFSSDGRYVAIPKESFQSFRYSTFGPYEIYQLSNGTVRSKYSVIDNETFIQLFVWNPNYGSNDYVIVSKNNIYYSSSPTGGSLLPITNSGNQFVYNGVADWLYEEEIFGGSSAIWWSPSGKLIAYASFNDTKVDAAEIGHHLFENPSTIYDEYPYPNAGTENNPLVELWVWDKQTMQTISIPKPEQLQNSANNGSYLFAVHWIVTSIDAQSTSSTQELLLSIWSNRAQTEVYFSLCNPSTDIKTVKPITKRIPFEIGSKKLWVEPQDFQTIANSDNSLFALLPRKYGSNIYNHISRISIKDLNIESYSGGVYDVNDIIGYSKVKDEIYFLAAGETIGQQHLYRITNITTAPDNTPNCITCEQQNCARTKAVFSPNANYFVLNCHSAYAGFTVSLWNTANVTQIKSLWKSSADHFKFELPEIKYETIGTHGGIDAYIQFIYPPRFNPQQLYPVLLYTYSGPNSIIVKDETPWELLTYLANSRQYIIISIDASGSGTRGWNIKERVYKSLGTREVDDQIDILKQLLNKYPYLDRSRVAAFGWSYGGFVTLHIAGRDGGNTVKCIAAVAPVVSFLYYDSAYSERYMGMVSENREAYEKSSLMAPYVSANYTSNFHNVKILLAHGAADDNVHYHNSAILASNLQSQLISFKQLVYTNEGHSLHSTINHLFVEVDKFLLEDCFNLQDV